MPADVMDIRLSPEAVRRLEDQALTEVITAMREQVTRLPDSSAFRGILGGCADQLSAVVSAPADGEAS